MQLPGTKPRSATDVRPLCEPFDVLFHAPQQLLSTLDATDPRFVNSSPLPAAVEWIPVTGTVC